MASTIKVDTIQSTTSNVFFQNSAGTEYARFDSSGNLGIGTTTPGNGLTVSRSSGESVINITNAGTNSAWLTLNPGSSGAAYIHNPTTRNTIFTTNTVERMSIDSSGVVALSGTASYTPRFEVMSIVDSNNQGLRMSGSGDTVFQHISATSNTLNFQQYYSGAWRTASQIVGNSTADFKFNSGYGSAATAYGCRAWVNFNGSGTVAIRSSGNVSSITDNNVGNYNINFTTSIVDSNYCVTFGVGGGGSGLNSAFVAAVLTSTQYGTATNKSTTAVQITTGDYTATLRDFGEVYVSIFR